MMTIGSTKGLMFQVAFILLAFSASGYRSYQQCLSCLGNIVLYEGTLNTILSCEIGPNATAWTIMPTSNATRQYQFIKFNDSVASSLSRIFAFNQSGVIIRNGTTAASGYDVSTAGVYFVSFDPAHENSNRTAIKVVVIRSGPICSCNPLNDGNVSVSCTIIYADHPSYPINAMMSCTANGLVNVATTPQRTVIPSDPVQYVFTSTSTVTAKYAGPTTYDCLVTFGAPVFGAAYLAKNAPDFSVTIQVPCNAATTTPAASIE